MSHTGSSLCSFACTGDRLIVQACFICWDCQDSAETKCCCEACASECHKGHDVVAIGYGKCFCDCAAGGCCSQQLVSASQAAAAQLLAGGRLDGTTPAGLDLTTRTFRLDGFTEERSEALRSECCRLATASRPEQVVLSD
ncbi:unnamed protein product [Polarella glacialis]|uniref:UBR-type domain-containing protein n=1 Tax=Polarella glacialis TaxID=89957 RepID=A0A813JTB8_POLGL|nr:unnamed protein product [Polarella glacialis]